MPHQYSIVEPHPSVTSFRQYISTGRGGAGNAIKPPTSVTRGSDASGPASRTALAQAPRTFYSGRGGAGNKHPPSQHAIFSFDEELEMILSQERHVAPVYYVGRGGAGNAKMTSSDPFFMRRQSDVSSRSDSSSSSGADYATRQIKKSLKKMAGLF